jgi:hypothetical protein
MEGRMDGIISRIIADKVTLLLEMPIVFPVP